MNSGKEWLRISEAASSANKTFEMNYWLPQSETALTDALCVTGQSPFSLQRWFFLEIRPVKVATSTTEVICSHSLPIHKGDNPYVWSHHVPRCLGESLSNFNWNWNKKRSHQHTEFLWILRKLGTKQSRNSLLVPLRGEGLINWALP